jgi:S-DNA-T family DNA segregation ATPase FtsK/SpoIIIE
MRIHLTLRPRDRPERDVEVDAPPGTRLAELRAVLPEWACPTRTGWWSGSRRLSGDALIGGPALRQGDVVGVGQVGPREPIDGSVLRLHAVGGPDAGGIWALPTGVHIIGRDAEADAPIDDPDVSRRHAALAVTSGGIRLTDLGSTNGTALDGRRIDPDGEDVLPGQLIRVGDTLLHVAPLADAPAVLRPRPDGRSILNRLPRAAAADVSGRIEFPAAPSRRSRPPMRWIAVLAPAAIGVGLALWMDSAMFLAFAVLSPVALLATALADRIGAGRGRRRDSRRFGREDAAARAALRGLLAAEVELRRSAHPDPAALRLAARIPTGRLWERHPGDNDWLQARLGYGDAPARVAGTRSGQPMRPPMAQSVPIVASLQSGPLGIASSASVAIGSARWVLMQLAALHSPADLRIVAALSDAEAEPWRWLRWLPHVDAIAVNDADRSELIDHLVDEIGRACGEAGPAAPPIRWTVLLLDRVGAVSDHPGLQRLLRDGARARISAVCIDESARRLPSACAATLELDAAAPGQAILTRLGSAGAHPVLVDRVRRDHAEQLARSLAALLDPADERTALPTSAGMLEIIALPDPTPAAIRERWAQGGGAPLATIGRSSRGRFDIDLVRDGPHALIAGTTGSGKSELLQTLVAGLAASASPQDLSFVLIDYKGGAAFARCADLPHAAGVVTDLDADLAQRALRSLRAELRRRETVLANADAPDIARHMARRRADPALPPLPRLVLVVDEFAALAEELPEFVGGLVDIAQRGRSLGVHLLLATQRPGGAVSPEIRANTNLRIALRVTDGSESRDVIGTDEAARIARDLPGRAFVRIGAAGESPIEVQTARISGPRTSAHAVNVRWLDEWRRARPPAEASEESDLDALVRAVRGAAVGLTGPTPPWREPLPLVLPLSDRRLTPSLGELVLGLLDEPDQQRQARWGLHLDQAASIALVGASRSGRTSALRTAAAQLHRMEPPVALHVLDCAAGELAQLGGSALCGVFATAEDAEALRRAVALLSDESARRRGSPPAAPAVLLIDGIDAALAALDQADPGRGAEALIALVRDAPSAGMTVIATGDRPTLAGRLGAAFAHKLLLRLNDRADYGLAGIAARSALTSAAPGRAVRALDGLQVQLAVLGDGSAASQQLHLEAALALTAQGAAPPAGHPAAARARRPAQPRFRPLPRLVRLADLTDPAAALGAAASDTEASDTGASDTEATNTEAAATEASDPEAVGREARAGDRDRALGNRTPGRVLLGTGGDDARPISLDVLAGPRRLLVAGPGRSGRSTALRLIATQLRGHGLRLAWIGSGGAGPAELDLAALGDPQVILIEDCQSVLDTRLGDGLAAIAAAPTPAVAIVGAGRTADLALTFRGVGAALVRARQAILLAPAPGDPDILGIRAPRVRSQFAPGRGVLLGPDGMLSIQLALPDDLSAEPAARDR